MQLIYSARKIEFNWKLINKNSHTVSLLHKEVALLSSVHCLECTSQECPLNGKGSRDVHCLPLKKLSQFVINTHSQLLTQTICASKHNVVFVKSNFCYNKSIAWYLRNTHAILSVSSKYVILSHFKFLFRFRLESICVGEKVSTLAAAETTS